MKVQIVRPEGTGNQNADMAKGICVLICATSLGVLALIAGIVGHAKGLGAEKIDPTDSLSWPNMNIVVGSVLCAPAVLGGAGWGIYAWSQKRC
jgi:hypothetical protein